MAGQLTLIVVVVVFKTFDDSLCRIILRRITIGFEVGYIGIEDGISMLPNLYKAQITNIALCTLGSHLAHHHVVGIAPIIVEGMGSLVVPLSIIGYGTMRRVAIDDDLAPMASAASM